MDGKDNLLELAETLIEGTRAGRVQWMKTDLPGSWGYVGSSGSVLLSEARQYGALGPRYTITILDADGIQVERHTTDPLLAERQELDARIRDLYEAASQSPRKRSAVVESLIREVAAEAS